MIRTEASLQELLDSEDYHAYVEARDPRNPLAQWEIIGDWRHEFFWIVLTNKKAITCRPRWGGPDYDFPMEHQPDGLAEKDAVQAETMAQDMWNQYQKELGL